ncbi:MAG: hypothetical protein LBR39_03130 [Coriobacteriales bacterium]|jgi:ABC-type transport system involved in multi-copper enzyme maturation permease subunit|nr:hypothetical protein [Coriobacteriales bacterium]
MLNYLLAEIYRILHKRSMYIYFGILAVFSILLIAVAIYVLEGVTAGDAPAGIIVSYASTFYGMIPLLLGCYLFAAIYTDDLASKNLGNLIGQGMSRMKIVLGKFILLVLFCVVTFGLAPLYTAAIFTVLGAAPTLADVGNLYIIVVQQALVAMGAAVVASIVVYGLQRPTFALVTFLLVVLGLVGQILSIVFSLDAVYSLAPWLTDCLMLFISGQVAEALASGTALLSPLIRCILYFAIAITLSILAFRQKELEF